MIESNFCDIIDDFVKYLDTLECNPVFHLSFYRPSNRRRAAMLENGSPFINIGCSCDITKTDKAGMITGTVFLKGVGETVGEAIKDLRAKVEEHVSTIIS